MKVIKCKVCEMKKEPSHFKEYTNYPGRYYLTCYECGGPTNGVPKKTSKPRQYVSSLKTVADLHNQRAARLGNNGRLCPKDLIIVSKKQRRCTYCKSSRELEFDHIVPLSKGGDNLRNNLQMLCHSCNALKGTMMPDAFEYKLALAML